ncbi:hypothetical protein L226DRAFT_127403 [Lentinus tigrinus ALCF2SS1-7]|uniref:Pentatricopeptide repeat-containing protein n=1 Tax=Lentinus tigrinus ALCF2SS1-6 TaxID=1328759 RepID=A0A5C2ST67_9APHY|nr:hypothetical protein L227DRAFT_13505 [Lentinus tigrinus ALCF2SS1-6]RPD81028.1 hypothetical protein L226DRAFT_127403 [Lentinus tigrinus ALCF2SS1-7]
MLRASSLGLTFTHGISRFPLQRHRFLHKQLAHDSPLYHFGAPRLHSTTKTEVEETIAMVAGTSHSHFPHTPHPIALPEEDSPPHEGRPQATASQHRSHRPRNMTSIAVPPSQSRGARKTAPPRYMHSRWGYEEHARRRVLYDKLAGAAGLEEAWLTYQALLNERPPHVQQIIPEKYLHSLAARLIARTRWRPSEKTRDQTVFHRLLSVLNTLYYSGGQVRLWEWNALIECSGKASGSRDTRSGNFFSALSILRDMEANRPPGSSLSGGRYVPQEDHCRVASKPVMPDIVSYTSLLAIAGSTLNEAIMRQADAMLASSGLQPNYVTHLVYLRYHSYRGELSGVRAAFSRIVTGGFKIDMYAINQLLWGFGRNGRLDIASLIYRILRHRLLVQHNMDPRDDYENAVRELDELEGITIPSEMKPDAICYYTLIQCYAYRGHFHRCIEVFTDMMTSPEPVTGPLVDIDMEDMDILPSNSSPIIPHPVLPIFRSIFLGFARHAQHPHYVQRRGAAIHYGEAHPEAWSLAQLRILFDQFIDLPNLTRPSDRTVYWLLSAFAITSGYDRDILRSVWERLSGRYGHWWDVRVDKFRTKIYAEEFDTAFFEHVRLARDRDDWSRIRRA